MYILMGIRMLVVELILVQLTQLQQNILVFGLMTVYIANQVFIVAIITRVTRHCALWDKIEHLQQLVIVQEN